MISETIKNPHRTRRLAKIACILLASCSTAFAGEFSNNFDAGMPANAKNFGSSWIDPSGGINKTGVVKLTRSKPDQTGTFIIDPLDGTPISSFVVKFKAFVGGGTGGEGFAVSFAPDLTDDAFDETGSGSGLIVSFDTRQNDGEPPVGVRISFGKTQLLSVPVGGLRASRFADVVIDWDATRGLNVSYNGKVVCAGVTIPGVTELKGNFAFSARTSSLTDWHCVDDLSIITRATLPSLVKSCLPADDNAPPDTAIEIAFNDLAEVDVNSLRVTLDNAVIEPGLTKNAETSVIRYQPPTLFEPGSRHTVRVAFSERGKPGVTHDFSYHFGVNPYIILGK
jgi:hypothetical protein